MAPHLERAQDAYKGQHVHAFITHTPTHPHTYTCQPIQFTSIKYKKIIILERYGHTGKWIQENTIFMRFCCYFKLRKKTEKLLNEQPTLAIAKCTLTGLVQ